MVVRTAPAAHSSCTVPAAFVQTLASDCSLIPTVLASSDLPVLQHQTASCVGRHRAASAYQPSGPGWAVPSSAVDRLQQASVQVPSFSSVAVAAEPVAVGNRHTGRTLAAAAADKPGTFPSDCQRSYSSAVVGAWTSVAVDNLVMTFQPAGGIPAAVGHRTGQARTAAVRCMVALHTHNHTLTIFVTHNRIHRELSSLPILELSFVKAIQSKNSLCNPVSWS